MTLLRWPGGFQYTCAAVFIFTWCPALAPAAVVQRFDDPLSRAQLEHYLCRAVTMEGLLHEHGSLDDEIRFLKEIGARFAGRTLYFWGGEANLEAALAAAKVRERKVHAALPDLICQAAIFEIVSEGVSVHTIPPRVFAEFRLPVERRTFSYEAMLFPDGKFRNHWGKGKSVPDITRPETQMWFFYLASRYLDQGIEAIHFGQIELMGARDRDRTAWDGLLKRVRAYAQSHARRRIVLCDAHVPRGGARVGERLLFDFHSFPLRIDEVPDQPMQGVLRMGHLDSLYGRSMGGTTPAGWTCEHLPYLVELDNFGRSGKEGRNIGRHWIWGYDEITWFAHLPREQRDQWLRYAHRWVREHDPNGFLQMPGSRTLAVPVNGTHWYWASNPGPLCPTGFGDEPTIRELWREDEAAE